ncbi:MAG: hypothetical protein KKB37_01280, partial [Alphaproteobacteria bacterium]|nr:hypothetical protein [Alphaproteobacteria bacterium]
MASDDVAATCDALAAGPIPAFSPGPAVTFAKLKSHADEAVRACTLAEKANPKKPRFAYQLARSMMARDHHDTNAVAWYRKAADMAYVPALNAVGVAYDKGFGVELNDATATRYFRQAADAKY